MPKVLVVGGGFAGVAAATALAQKGHSVDLLESRGFLGGRVYSTAPTKAFPYACDNGPHLFMGCYRETLALLRRLGVENSFRWIDPLRLSWLTPGGKVSLQCARFPAPFHLAYGLLTSNAFPFGEKISLARALLVFSKKPFKINPGLETVSQFLDASGQGPAARKRFWVPLSNAVMNIGTDIAPLRGLGEVLHHVFFGSRFDSAFGLAIKPLSELAFPQVAPYLEEKGGMVHFHERIQTIQVHGNDFTLTGRSGKTYSGDALVLAVSPASLHAVWPKGSWPALETLPKLGKSPILSVHLILSLEVTCESLVGLSGAQFEWVFNRNANWNWRGEGQYLSFTASAAEKLSRMTDKELVDLAAEELKVRCPLARKAQVLHSKVTREMSATFRWSRETDSLRPPCETPFPHIFLAGDFTDTGLPATIEGACLSGHKAAEKAQEVLGKKT